MHLDGIGEDIAERIRKMIDKHQDAGTRAALLKTLSNLSKSVERLCPAVLSPIGVAYGPAAKVGETLFIFATITTGMITAIKSWPEVGAPPQEISRSAMWAVVDKYVEDGDGAGATIVVAALMAAQTASVRAQVDGMRADGLTPAIVVICARENDLACGAAAVIALPASIEAQVAGLEARNAAKH